MIEYISALMRHKWHGDFQERDGEVEGEKESNNAVELRFKIQVMRLDLVAEGRKQRKVKCE